MDIRLTSCNVNCFPWSFTAIRQKVAELVNENQTDIITLQGVWCRHPEWAAAFAEHGWTFIRPARESQFAALFGSGLAVAISRRWRLLDSRLYPFISGIDIPGMKGWFRVDLENVARGYPLRLLNVSCQLSLLGGEEIRMAQGRQLTETEKDKTIPTLLTGEFNTDENWFHGFRRQGDCLYPAVQSWTIYTDKDSDSDSDSSWLCRLKIYS